ncbi:organic hydroperoxide resistance protein [Pseudomonas typographi]|uniref:organic hydroperoxide resistance protein n=1 Tax=Pseudomonas typographi TaxID=2715964 RepID=UPI001688EA8C|nr:organic hydroperoxide resistance protein [Pseudomonas typographi]MBD1551432.1 organic hydroperoxide resistance protein [Pseudomonas typographi]
MSKPLYTTKVTAIGGRAGHVRSDDDLLDLSLALPAGLGGKGGATNPEQLFAAGYAACFENAVLHVARGKKVEIADNDVEVVATVSLLPDGNGGFKLSVGLDVAVANLDSATAEAIVEAAHAVCPYSNAVRGNVEVAIAVSTR